MQLPQKRKKKSQNEAIAFIAIGRTLQSSVPQTQKGPIPRGKSQKWQPYYPRHTKIKMSHVGKPTKTKIAEIERTR